MPSPIIADAATRPYTSADEVAAAHAALVRTFAAGRTKDLRWRKWQLKQLWWMFDDNERAIAQALALDMGRPELEARVEVAQVKAEILLHLDHLEEWAADEPVREAGFLLGTLGGARVRREPRGVALLIGAWNMPFKVTLAPLVAAVSAGCCAVVKPSELAVASQNIMADLAARYLDPEAVRVVTGGAAETGGILELPFDHVFYTGSGRVGRLVAAAAARHLTPTVMELGGTNPAVVTASADVDLAAKRIAFAKRALAGQICTTVNHIFADPAVHDELVERLAYWTRELCKDDEGRLQEVSQTVSERHYERVTRLLESTKGTVHRAHEPDSKRNLIAPTTVSDIGPDDPIMSEELFAPVCAVLKATCQEAVAKINSKDRAEINYILDNTSSGGVTINDTFFHGLVEGAPFGGVGGSGHGYYHGKHGVREFTYQRAVVEIPLWLEPLLSSRYSLAADKNPMSQLVKLPRGRRFRRGETLQDQVVGQRGPSAPVKLALVIAVVGVVGSQLFPAKIGRFHGFARWLEATVRAWL
ncbi:uncharacterized protein E0L32_000451 [Thyridium curvatum]|uniref:Aldehyde dehydrogenase n=1 Tax=Thyridium curvatum TaxID=1093900 RepID=A0A507B2T9_9PEZI|nr:uncharacterized protein E0L32_000451 [Thyridium curvatum]TPX14057.1 hypothetical protein E0L32_000451 [Thyridium curvatum]